MFEKLFNLVKVNAGTAIMENPAIPEKLREAALNDASSSIIEVLKSQVETGRLKDLVKYFQFSGIYENPLITSATEGAGDLIGVVRIGRMQLLGTFNQPALVKLLAACQQRGGKRDSDASPEVARQVDQS